MTIICEDCGDSFDPNDPHGPDPKGAGQTTTTKETPVGNEKWAVVNLCQQPMKFTFWHPSEEAARKEAERLARGNPMQRFAIVKAVASVGVPETPVRWSDKPEDITDDLPF